MEQKIAALLSMGQLQMDVSALFFQAESAKASGYYESARPIYEDYIDRSRDYLQAALEFNRRFPESTWDISPIVQPLVNAMLVLADLLQALNDRDSANTLRRDAKKLLATHLGRSGSAKTELTIAGALTLEGRFNEAIFALMCARDLFSDKKDTRHFTRA